MNLDLKIFVRDNKPAKLVGGPLYGKEIFIPSDQSNFLKMPVPLKPPTIYELRDPPIMSTFKTAIYRETIDRYNWIFDRLD